MEPTGVDPPSYLIADIPILMVKVSHSSFFQHLDKIQTIF